MTGSTARRQISFFAIRPNALAMAVGPDSWAATRLQDKTADHFEAAVPDSPVWISIPSEKLRNMGPLDALLSPLADALPGGERVSVQAALHGGTLEVEAAARCRTAAEAQALKVRMEAAAGAFRAASSRAETAGAFAGLVDGIRFEATGERFWVRLPGALPALRALLSRKDGAAAR
jgi:hypothetical protein